MTGGRSNAGTTGRERDANPAGGASYVVVGGGLAGAKAAEAIRGADPDGTIAVVGAESRRPYERPDLSKAVLLGKKSAEELYVHAEGWYAESAVDLLLGQAATGLDRERQVVTLADGRELGYDRLLLATGATPRRLNVPGADLDGMHYLRTADDSAALIAAIGAAKSVVVVGGGWIGLEVAAGAREQGRDVTVIEPQPTPLFGVMGEQVGEIWAQLHRAHDVDVRSGVQVNAIQGEDGRATGVVLGNGQVVSADVIVVGVGAAPNLELAEAVVLSGQVGEIFDGTVTDIDQRGARIQLKDPAVITRVPVNGLEIGASIRLRLEEADPARRLTRFSLA